MWLPSRMVNTTSNCFLMFGRVAVACVQLSAASDSTHGSLADCRVVALCVAQSLSTCGVSMMTAQAPSSPRCVSGPSVKFYCNACVHKAHQA